MTSSLGKDKYINWILACAGVTIPSFRKVQGTYPESSDPMHLHGYHRLKSVLYGSGLFIMRPKPDNFNDMFFFINLIHNPMLDIYTA